MVLRSLGLALLLLGSWTPAIALHDDLHDQIAAATRALARRPGDEEMRIRRADLYRRHEEWDQAFADLARVRDARGTTEYALVRGRLFRDRGYPVAATTVADAHLRARPDDHRVRLFRARVLEERGRMMAALADLDQALASWENAEPDAYVNRARVARSCAELGEDSTARALSGLDQGLARLGPIPALQLVAIELELERGAVDPALDRLETLRRASPRQERWLAERGEILRTAGRPAEAREAFRASLAALRSLKPKQRSTQSVRKLEQRVLARLRDLSTIPDSPSSGNRP